MIDTTAKEKIVTRIGPDQNLDRLEDRICYAYDATRKRRIPDAVAILGTVSNISEIMKIANEFKIPVLARGAGSGFTGGSIPVEGGIVIVMYPFNGILDIDTDNLQATAESGVLTWDLHQAVEALGLF